jgi:hypothetical protein
LSIVLWRRLKNGCDFGSGGGASGIRLRLLKLSLREQQQYAPQSTVCGENWTRVEISETVLSVEKERLEPTYRRLEGLTA